MWSREELDRYSRHMLLSQVGASGQAQLKAAKVVVVGAGGLGSPVLLYLAAAGVGTLGIVEMDTVSLSNLQRQVLYATPHVGHSKAQQAKARLLELNPNLNIHLHPFRINAQNALETLVAYDLVIDCSDNFPTRYLLNDACVALGKPLVHGAIQQFEGQVTVFNYQNGPCYRCLFPNPPKPGSVPSCSEAGVLGVLPGVIGSLMATEALKVLLQIGSPLSGNLLVFDALGMQFHNLGFAQKTNCVACGHVNGQIPLQDYDAFCGLPE